MLFWTFCRFMDHTWNHYFWNFTRCRVNVHCCIVVCTTSYSYYYLHTIIFFTPDEPTSYQFLTENSIFFLKKNFIFFYTMEKKHNDDDQPWLSHFLYVKSRKQTDLAPLFLLKLFLIIYVV